jgi:TolA-binding protein
VLGGAIVVVIAFAIYSQVSNARAEKAAGLAATLQTDYSTWTSETDAKKKDALHKSLIAQIDTILKKYPRSYGAQRALFIRADIAFHDKNWKVAETTYAELASRFPSSYLAPVSLINAAAAAENAKDIKQAIALDKKVLNYKGIVAPEVPEALFSLGRLYETSGDTKEAKTYYNELINNYPSSGWTNLAQDRIIYLAAKANPSGTTTGASGQTGAQGQAGANGQSSAAGAPKGKP